jgi:hypothetical protein
MKTFLIYLLIFFSAEHLSAVCFIYIDCEGSVESAKSQLENKLNQAFQKTETNVDNLESSYQSHIDELNKQNIEIENLERLSGQNSLTLQDILHEQKQFNKLLLQKQKLFELKNKQILLIEEKSAIVNSVKLGEK